MQSRLKSLEESFLNVLIGYGVAITSQVMIFPFYGVHIPLSANLEMGIWFTFISIARSYCIRRWYNRKLTKRYSTNG